MKTIRDHTASRARSVGVAALLAVAGMVQAAECTLNVHDAYQTAKLRAWTFKCSSGTGLPANFVVYPGQNIGCAFRTPPITTQSGDGLAAFFETGSSGAHFKNGWNLKSVEFSGAQWTYFSNPKVRVRGKAQGLKTANKTYNFRLSKLVLEKSGGQCAKAIDEAF